MFWYVFLTSSTSSFSSNSFAHNHFLFYIANSFSDTPTILEICFGETSAFSKVHTL